jgi:hypothetical protein
MLYDFGTATFFFFFFFFFFFLLRSLAQHADKFSLVSLRSFTDESSFVHTTRGLIVYSPVVHAGVLQDPRYPSSRCCSPLINREREREREKGETRATQQLE